MPVLGGPQEVAEPFRSLNAEAGERGPGLGPQLPGAALRAGASEVQCPQAPGLPELWPQARPTRELSPSVRGLSELMTLRRSWQHHSRGSVGTTRVEGVPDCPDGATERSLLEVQACQPSGGVC